MRLYMVTASESDYDTFECGVVYANSEADAVAVVQETIAAKNYELLGAWWDLDSGAVLAAKPVERKRGPVLAFGMAG